MSFSIVGYAEPPETSTVKVKFETIYSEECKFIPKFSKLPLECCVVPELFEETVRKNCKSKCESSSSPRCCTIKCIFELSDLLDDDEKFNKTKAKVLMEQIFLNRSDILSFTDRILNRCEEKGMKFNFVYFFSMISDFTIFSHKEQHQKLFSFTQQHRELELH